MANNNIIFKIGSVFSGEGFKKARNEVNAINSEMKKGMSAASGLAGSIGSLDAANAKAVTALTGLCSALLTLSPTVILTQAAIMAFNYIMGEWEDQIKKDHEAVEKLKTALKEINSENIKTSMEMIKTEIEVIGGDFERVTKQINEFNAAISGVKTSEMAGNIINLEVEKLNELLAAHSDAERQAIEQTYNLKIAIEKRANAETEWQMKLDEAHDKITQSEKKISICEDQLSVIQANRAELERQITEKRAAKNEAWKALQDQLNALSQQQIVIEKKKADEEAKLDVLRIEEQKVKQDALNATAQATLAVKNAELADTKLTEAKQHRAAMEEAARNAADVKASADLIDAQELKTAADIQREVNQSARDLATAQNNYAKAMAEYNANFLIAQTARDYVKGGGKAGVLPVDVQKSVQMTTADAAVDEAIRKGAITTVKDADKLQREVMHKTRDQITKEQKQQLVEAKKADRIRHTNLKARSEADKKFLAKYEAIEKAAKEQKEALDQAKETADKAKSAQETAAKDLDEIKKKMDAIGLK